MNGVSLLPDLPIGARVLIVRLRSLGDIVLLTPSLRLLKEWRPDLRFSVVAEKRFHPLLAGNPNLEEVLDAGEGRCWQKPARELRAALDLRKRNFSLCVNLHGGPTSAFLTRLSGARWKAGFEHFRNSGLYDILIPDARRILNQAIVHTAEHQASAFFWLGLPRRRIPAAELFVSPAAEARWNEVLKRLEVTEYALLHPPALYATKAWPAERFARLGRYFEEEMALSTVFSCGPGESPSLDEVESASGHPIRRLDQPELSVFMASISRARLFVGNDSGPAHMAAAFERPLVVIFGSSNSKIWHPWAGSRIEADGPSLGAESSFRVVENAYECNPCPGDRCYRFAQPECILSITFEQVRAAVDSLLNPVSGASGLRST
ncbi:MAG: glycosyltransferase family 9 protein [Terriglobia bacterium]